MVVSCSLSIAQPTSRRAHSHAAVAASTARAPPRRRASFVWVVGSGSWLFELSSQRRGGARTRTCLASFCPNLVPPLESPRVALTITFARGLHRGSAHARRGGGAALSSPPCSWSDRCFGAGRSTHGGPTSLCVTFCQPAAPVRVRVRVRVTVRVTVRVRVRVSRPHAASWRGSRARLAPRTEC